MQVLSEAFLKQRYLRERKSAHDVAQEIGCSENKVHYWLAKYGIPKRKISEAVYVKSNPQGDPFVFKFPSTNEEWFLFGLGIGLYWGEGNKANKQSVRLGNTDPDLIRTFLRFLVEIYGVDTRRLRFGLQIFSDVKAQKALQFWVQKLEVSRKQFQKIVVTPSRGNGTYKKKSPYGVLTVNFSNTKLRDSIVSAIERLRR